MSTKQRVAWLIALVVIILVIDQIIKIYVKTHFALNESVSVFGNWFQILFIENKGMAFGLQIGGKLLLSLFRLVASGLLIYYLVQLVKGKYSLGYILCIGGVLAGAVGNLIDSAFYGLIFSESSFGQVATLFPVNGGYDSLFYGRVVDMFYFPLITNAQGEVLFFSPVFNFADSAVTVSVVLILIFFRKELNESLETKKKEELKNV